MIDASYLDRPVIILQALQPSLPTANHELIQVNFHGLVHEVELTTCL